VQVWFYGHQMSFTDKITEYWYKPAEQVPFALKLLSNAFAFISQQRKKGYLNSPSKVYRAPVPLVVVGNIFVGGTGKTPLVIALVELLKQHGIKAGVISRGYGGQKLKKPEAVFAHSDPLVVGDEPVLIATRAKCPVVVYPKRAEAIQTLLAHNDADVIISDDGLQHYAMARDIEIVVIDGERRVGNGLLLPAGPLREPVSRLNNVDYCVVNGDAENRLEHSMHLTLSQAYALNDDTQEIPLSTLQGKTVNAVAGIGNPARFFDGLKTFNINVLERSFPDHYAYKLGDLTFSDDFPILLTEKDAVKCRYLPLRDVWVVPVVANLEQSFKSKFVNQVTLLVNRVTKLNTTINQ